MFAVTLVRPKLFAVCWRNNRRAECLLGANAIAVIGTAAGLNCKTTDAPQLPFGAKAVRGLQNTQQHRSPDRTDRGNLTEPLPGLLFLALC